MLNKYLKFRLLVVLFALSGIVVSCKPDEETPDPVAPTVAAFRTPVSYSTLTSSTLYDTTFVDETGDTTVDRNDGRILLNMFKGLSAYAGTAVSANVQLDSAVYENMFANKNSGFTGAAYSFMNGNALQLRNITASSYTAAIANDVRYDMSVAFGNMAKASTSRAATASAPPAPGSPGVAGVLSFTNPSTGNISKYLVDERGIEWAQIIQKSMIGATQLDYICNKLLDKGLNANNTTLVVGKKYTQLEHNWDIAYGFLTVNNIYNQGAVNGAKNSKETLLGSYVWEYNKASYDKVHMAFLKGRAAIVNNDKAEVKVQADFIRKEFEKAIAAAAVGYLTKWKNGATEAERAHAIGEGAGFIYSLRFCKMYGANEGFSDTLISDLGIYTGNGVWDLTAIKASAAISTIETKFGLK